MAHSKGGSAMEVADYILAGMRSVEGFKAELYDVMDFNSLNRSLDELLEFDIIVFGSPTYFGDISAEMKAFFDSTSKIWLAQQWRDKLACAFTISGSPCGDKTSTILSYFTFACQHSMIWVSCGVPPEPIQDGEKSYPINMLGGWTGLIAQSKLDPIQSRAQQLTAHRFGARAAKFTCRLAK